jgi:signal peptidase II
VRKFLAIFVLLVIFDQLTKFLFLQFRPDLEGFLDLSPVFKFDYLKNTGVALSFLSGSWVVFPLVLTALLAIAYYFSRNRLLEKHPVLSGMLFAGAIGNLIDRVSQGYVLDFLNLATVSVVNFADIMITFSLVGLIITDMVKYRKRKSDFSSRDF